MLNKLLSKINLIKNNILKNFYNINLIFFYFLKNFLNKIILKILETQFISKPIKYLIKNLNLMKMPFKKMNKNIYRQ